MVKTVQSREIPHEKGRFVERMCFRMDPDLIEIGNLYLDRFRDRSHCLNAAYRYAFSKIAPAHLKIPVEPWISVLFEAKVIQKRIEKRRRAVARKAKPARKARK